MLSVDDKFLTLDEAGQAIQTLLVDDGLSYKLQKSEAKRHIVVCEDPTCSFRIWVSQLWDIYRVTIMEAHICSPLTHFNFQAAHSVTYLADHHRSLIVDNWKTLPRTIQAAERLQYGNQINYQQALEVREKLQEEIEGDKNKMFKKLPALYG